MKKLVSLINITEDTDINEVVDQAMNAIHGDDPWPEDDGMDSDEDDAESSPSADLDDGDSD